MMKPSENEVQHTSTPRVLGLFLRLGGWFASGMAVIGLLSCVAFALLVNSDMGHRYLLGLAERKASEALGVSVRLENFVVHLPTLSLDIYGIRIAGAAPHVNPPLLQADHLKVGIRIVSVLGKSWYLDQIQLDHPVAWIVVDKNGSSNLPVFKSSGSSSHTDMFDLGIRHVQIDRGEVYYNARRYALAADVHGVAFDSVFNSLLKQYSGKLAYSNGNLALGTLRPLQHDLEADFSATPKAFTLRRASVTAGASRAVVNATVEGYDNPMVRAQYRIVVEGRQAAKILNEPAIPAGTVQTSGTLQFQSSPNRTTIQSLDIRGELGSRNLVLNTPKVRGSVANLSARYSLADGNAVLENLHANLLGGDLLAHGTMQGIGGNSHTSVRLDLHKMSLTAVEQSLGSSASMKEVSLNGAADATATASWGKTIDDLIARVDLTLEGSATRRPEGKIEATAARNALDVRSIVPIQGVVHALYSNAGQTLTLNNSSLKSSQTSVLLNGTVSRQSSLTVSLQANDLSEIATLANAFRNSTANAPALDLKGKASFHGTVRGSTASPELTGQLSAANLEYNGTRWKALNCGVELSASRAGVQGLRLEGIDRGQVAGDATVELRDWSFNRQSAMRVNLTASDIPSTEIEHLVGSSIPLVGSINASAHLHGPAIAPTGNASLRLTNATAFGEAIEQARVDLTGSANNVKANATVQLAAGTIRAQATTDPMAQTYNAQVTSDDIDIEKVQALRTRGIDAKGVLEIHAQGQGSYDDPAVNANLEIPSLTLNGKTISHTRVQLNEAHHVANVDLASSVANSPIHGKAQVELKGDFQIDGSLDTPAIPIEPLLAAYAPEEDADLTGQVEMHATIHGPLKNKNLLQAHLKIPLLKVEYGKVVQLEASPIQADYQQGLVRLQPVTIRGTDTELNLQGAFPASGEAPASLQAHGSIDLRMAQIFDEDLQSSGQLKLNIDSHGTTTGSLLAGEIEIADANLSETGTPLSLQHANGALKLTSDRLTIEKFEGTVGGGSVAAQGAVIYRPNLRLDLGAAIKGAEMLYPQGMRETADAALRLTGTAKHASLGGLVTLTNLSFTPAFDLSKFVSQFSGGVEVPKTPGLEQNLQLNLTVNSTNNTSLVSRTLSVDGSAHLQVRGTASDPVILGRVNLTGGDVILNGNRFVLTGGTVQFINPAATEPVLNIALTTTVQEYKIDLRFRGPSDQMRTQYSSNPSLPQADIINLLAFGQTTEASAMNSTPMNQQAEGLVASQVANQVTSRISKAAGISQLSISPVIAGGTAEGPPGANLTIQQRVTGNLFVTFSTNVATTQGQTIQGQYQVSPRVTVSATRDPNGGFALDTLIKKSW